MIKAKVQGIDVIIYDYEREQGGKTYCSCYFPELGYRLPVLAELVEVGIYDKI